MSDGASERQSSSVVVAVGIWCLFVACAIGVFFLPVSTVGETVRVDRDAFTARVVVDEEFAALPGWKARVDQLMQPVSDGLFAATGHGLRVVVIEEWASPDDVETLVDMISVARRELTWDEEDFVLVFNGQETTDFGSKGGYYSNIVVFEMCEPDDKLYRFQSETILQQIAHCMGAWPARDGRGATRMKKSGEPTYDFNASAAYVLAANRDMDTRLGPASRPEDVREDLHTRWLAGAEKGDTSPIALGFIERAHRLEVEGVGDAERRVCWLEALLLFEADDRGPEFDWALCLRMLGSSECDRRNLGPATRYLTAAVAMYDELGITQRRVEDSRMQLAWAELLSGRAEEAATLFRYVLKERSRIRGVEHEETGEAHEFLGRALEDLGKTADAREQYLAAERVYRKSGSRDHAIEVRARIRDLR